MKRSEIFDNFVKIAQEKGLISNDSEASKKKLEKTHRADSLDLSDIEALYGVKPDAPKNMEYERNIMEVAHPNSLVISPSYDKLNGLVENNNERQDILLHIVHKTPDGLLTQRKYATKDLVLTLVRLANDLDNKNHEELRILADTCLLQASETVLKKNSKNHLIKTALEPITMTLMGSAALLGALYVQQHMKFINEGFKKNHEKLIAEVDDLLSANSSWFVGYDYSQDFINLVTDFKNKLMAFHAVEQKVEPLISQLEKPRTAPELLELAQQPETKNLLDAFKMFKDASFKFLPYLNKIMQDFSSESYKQKQVQDKGFLSSLVDKTQLLHGGKGLVADDFDDVVRAISAYKAGMEDIGKVLANAESIEKSATNQLQNAVFENQKMFGKETENAGNFGPNETSAPGSINANKTVEDIDQEASNLETELKNTGIPGLV